jgi:hypothetical protein
MASSPDQESNNELALIKLFEILAAQFIEKASHQMIELFKKSTQNLSVGGGYDNRI